MQTKPYNLQAPEDIAKEYGGNKQKIAKAAQMGLLDPTAAVLAGMFIDRMRGAQAQEQVPQQTVAQQTFAPPAPAPMQSPQRALGATPQAPQMMAMQQQMAPRRGVRGMDRIPTNPNMIPSAAGGGLVAFAAGDRVSGGMSEEDRARLERERFEYLKNYNENVVPELQEKTARLLRGAQDEEAELENATGLAAQLQNAKYGRAQPYGLAGRNSPGALPFEKDLIAGKGVGGYGQGLQDAIEFDDGAKSGPIMVPIKADGTEAEPSAFETGDIRSTYDEVQDIIGASDDRYKKYLESAAERADANRKEDLWTALTQFGFNMAASGKPTFLEAAGEAGAKTMPTITSAIKEQRKAKAEAEKELANVGAVTRAQNIKLLEASMSKVSDQDKMKLQKQIADERNALAKDLQGANAATQIAVANINAMNPDSFESRVITYQNALLEEQRKGREDLQGLSPAAIKAMASDIVAGQNAAAQFARLGVQQQQFDVTQRTKIYDAVKEDIASLDTPRGAKFRKAAADGNVTEQNKLIMEETRARLKELGIDLPGANTTGTSSSMTYTPQQTFNSLPEDAQKQLRETVLEQGGPQMVEVPNGEPIAGIPVFNGKGKITGYIPQTSVSASKTIYDEAKNQGYEIVEDSDGNIVGFISL